MRKIKELNILFSLAVAAFCILVSQFVFCPAYDTNDDMLMQLISSGVISGEPNPYLYLSSTLLGGFLAWLNGISTVPNWYYIQLCFFYFLFIVAMVNYAVKFSEQYKMLLIVVFVAVIGISVLVKPQFTTAGILLSFSAFIYLLHALNFSSVKYAAAGFAMLVLSVLIRFEVLVIFLVLFSIPLLYVALQKRSWKFSIALLITVTLLFVNNYFEKREMSNIVGFDIRSYVHATEIIIDNPARITQQALDKVNWSNSAITLMNSFFFIDPDVFSYQKTILFSEQVIATNSFLNTIRVLSKALMSNFYLLVLLLLLIAICNGMHRDKLAVYICIASFLLIIFLSFSAKLPNRVLLPILVADILLVLIRGNYEEKLKYVKIGGLSLTLVLILLNTKTSSAHRQYQQQLSYSLEYFKRHPGNIYQLSYSGFPFIGAAGFENKFHGHPANILGFGWLVGTPAYYDQLKRFKIDNHLSSLITRDDIHLVAGNQHLRNALQQFALDYYKRHINYERVESTPLPVFNITSNSFVADISVN